VPWYQLVRKRSRARRAHGERGGFGRSGYLAFAALRLEVIDGGEQGAAHWLVRIVPVGPHRREFECQSRRRLELAGPPDVC